MRFAGYACLLVRDVVWCQSDANLVQNRLQKVRSIQFACLSGPTARSFISVRNGAAKSPAQFVQFSSFSSVRELFRPWMAVMVVVESWPQHLVKCYSRRQSSMTSP